MSHIRSIALLLTLLATASPVATAEDLYLVVGSYASEDRATKAAEKLSGTADLEISVLENGGLFRLVFGPLTEAGVEAGRTILRQQGIDHWLWRNENVSPLASETLLVSVAVSDTDANGGETNEGETLSLVEAVHRGIENNLRLLASLTRIEAAEGETELARAARLPQIGFQASQQAIDADRADASNGRFPEYQTFAAISLQQLIYSDDVAAAHQIRSILEDAAGDEYEARLQDTVLNVATSYLSVLRADSLVAVFENDLKLTESNLERANIRLSYGVANKSEVYRWETRLASSQGQLVNAIASAASARVNLNKVLNQPLDERQMLAKPELGDKKFLLSDQDLLQALQNPENKTPGFEFWQDIALENAPELALAQRQLSVSERTLLAAQRTITRPTVSLAGDYRVRVAKGGAGVEQLDFTIPGTGEQIGGTMDEIEWNFQLAADIDLYAGGGNLATIQTAAADVGESRLLLDETRLNIRAQLLSQYYIMLAALQNIEYSRLASDAGAKNLDLVVESYASGVVTIIDLLDAQLAALRAALDAANAEYDFLIEYFRLQRIAGKFDLLMDPADRDRMRQDLSARLVR